MRREVFENVQVGTITVIADVEATRAAYERYEPYVCPCGYCRNFRAVWASIVNGPIAEAVAALGIEIAAPVESVHYGELETGVHLYEVEWAFLGAESRASGARDCVLGGVETRVYPNGIPDLHFDTTGRRWTIAARFNRVPWVLDEPPGDAADRQTGSLSSPSGPET